MLCIIISIFKYCKLMIMYYLIPNYLYMYQIYNLIYLYFVICRYSSGVKFYDF